MPYKVFVAGEEALAADANAYLMSQTVPRFTNASQRTSQLTAPVLNQLSMLDSRPGMVQYWNGTAWIDKDTFVQSGTTAVTTNANGEAAVIFPVAFGAAPHCTANIGGANYGGLCTISDPFPLNYVGVQLWNFPGSPPVRPVASSTLTVCWVAHGIRA